MPEVTPPIPVEVTDVISIYNAPTDKWTSGWYNIFTGEDENKYAPINIASAGDNIIIIGIGGKTILITSIVLTVGGEVNITFYDALFQISGPMDFGGTSEPRGMVAHFGFSPIQLQKEASFIINLSAAVQVSGFVCYRQKKI